MGLDTAAFRFIGVKPAWSSLAMETNCPIVSSTSPALTLANDPLATWNPTYAWLALGAADSFWRRGREWPI
jgi:hypothetical protein